MHFLSLTNEQQTEAILSMSRAELGDIVKLSLAGKVMGMAYDRLYADLEFQGEHYRWHKGMEGMTVIKQRTYGKDGNGYGGWSFFKKFKSDELQKAQDAWMELCFKAENPELIEIEETDLQPLEKSNCAPVHNLQSVAEQIDSEYGKFQEAETAATIHAIRLGVMLEFVKEKLPHGQLGGWIEENCELTQNHLQRFRNIAKKFLKEKKINAGQLFLGQPMINTIGGAEDVINCTMNEESDQMLFAFIDGRTLPELCEDLNVRWRDPVRLGGDTSGAAAKPLPKGETQNHLLATQCLGKLQKEVNIFVVDKTTQKIKHLTPKELKDLFDTFSLAARAIEDQIKAG